MEVILAVELYNDSYEVRVYSNTSGMLYNVKMNMGNAGEFGANKKQEGVNNQDPNKKSNDPNMNNDPFTRGKGGDIGAENPTLTN